MENRFSAISGYHIRWGIFNGVSVQILWKCWQEMHWMWLQGHWVMLKSAGMVSGHLPLLAEALPEGPCSY